MADVNQLTKEAIDRGNINDLLAIWRGLNNRREGYDVNLNAAAGQRLAELAGVDYNLLSGMHDAEIVQAAQGQGEKRKIEEQARNQQEQINKFADDFSGRAKSKRDELAQAMMQLNQQAFELQNPYILEDLNSRGLFRSPTAVNQAQTEAMKELELGRQNSLLAFDTSAFGQEQDLRSGALSALLGGEQSALDTALDARRSGLEMAYNQSLSAQEQALAKSLAKRKSRSDLTNSLINAGSNLARGAMSYGMA